MRAIFTESLVHENLFNTVVYGSNETHIIMHKLENVKLESTEILDLSFFLFISSDSCHKNMLLESLNIPLSYLKPRPTVENQRYPPASSAISKSFSIIVGSTFKITVTFSIK